MGLLGSAECPTDVWVYLEMAQRAAAQGDIEEAERQEAFAYNVPPGSGQNYSETSLCSVDYAQTKQAIALARAGDAARRRSAFDVRALQERLAGEQAVGIVGGIKRHWKVVAGVGAALFLGGMVVVVLGRGR